MYLSVTSRRKTSQAPARFKTGIKPERHGPGTGGHFLQAPFKGSTLTWEAAAEAQRQTQLVRYPPKDIGCEQPRSSRTPGRAPGPAAAGRPPGAAPLSEAGPAGSKGPTGRAGRCRRPPRARPRRAAEPGAAETASEPRGGGGRGGGGRAGLRGPVGSGAATCGAARPHGARGPPGPAVTCRGGGARRPPIGPRRRRGAAAAQWARCSQVPARLSAPRGAARSVPGAAAAGTRGRGAERSPAQSQGAHRRAPLPLDPAREPQPAGAAPAARDRSPGAPRLPAVPSGRAPLRAPAGTLAVRGAEARGRAEQRRGSPALSKLCRRLPLPTRERRRGRPARGRCSWRGRVRAAAASPGEGPTLADDRKC